MSNNENSKKFCYSCGNELVKEAEICPKCGVRQPLLSTPVKETRSKTTAALFALFLGPLGIHKFYLGEKNQGITYLLITLFGSLIIIGPIVMAIISLIEGIKLLLMSESDFNQKYNQI